MREVARHYPDDADAAALYAESIMDLHSSNFWISGGKPTEDTEELIGTLQAVLRQNPSTLAPTTSIFTPSKPRRIRKQRSPARVCSKRLFHPRVTYCTYHRIFTFASEIISRP